MIVVYTLVSILFSSMDKNKMGFYENHQTELVVVYIFIFQLYTYLRNLKN